MSKAASLRSHSVKVQESQKIRVSDVRQGGHNTVLILTCYCQAAPMKKTFAKNM